MGSDSVAEQVTGLDALIGGELSQAQRDLNEVRVLIKQTSGEVERLTQRANTSLARLREVETNLENFSRQELRQVFVAASESQLRLFMMQAQLEQLQSRQRSLEKYIETMQKASEMLLHASRPGGVARGSVSSDTGRESAASQQSIAEIIQAQEDERNRIAKQIHDGPAQALTNVVLRAEICERLIKIDADRARSELAQLKDLVASTLRDTRRFIFDVRPMILDDLGVLPTIRKYLETFGEKSKFAVDLTVVGKERRMAPHIEVTVFRIIQEALQNVAQHANATRVRVTVDTEGEQVDLVIEDDGEGFDAGAILAGAQSHGVTSIGIASMLERAEILGGRISFESASGRGNRLLATIPLGN